MQKKVGFVTKSLVIAREKERERGTHLILQKKKKKLSNGMLTPPRFTTNKENGIGV